MTLIPLITPYNSLYPLYPLYLLQVSWQAEQTTLSQLQKSASHQDTHTDTHSHTDISAHKHKHTHTHGDSGDMGNRQDSDEMSDELRQESSEIVDTVATCLTCGAPLLPSFRIRREKTLQKTVQILLEKKHKRVEDETRIRRLHDIVIEIGTVAEERRDVLERLAVVEAEKETCEQSLKEGERSMEAIKRELECKEEGMYIYPPYSVYRGYTLYIVYIPSIPSTSIPLYTLYSPSYTLSTVPHPHTPSPPSTPSYTLSTVPHLIPRHREYSDGKADAVRRGRTRSRKRGIGGGSGENGR